MKKIIHFAVATSVVLLAGSTYADLTLKVSQAAKSPVTFTMSVSAKGIPAVQLNPVVVQPGQQATVDIRGQYGSQLSQFRGNHPMLSVNVGKQRVSFKGEPGSDHTVTYNGHRLMK